MSQQSKQFGLWFCRLVSHLEPERRYISCIQNMDSIVMVWFITRVWGASSGLQNYLWQKKKYVFFLWSVFDYLLNSEHKAHVLINIIFISCCFPFLPQRVWKWSLHNHRDNCHICRRVPKGLLLDKYCNDLRQGLLVIQFIEKVVK